MKTLSIGNESIAFQSGALFKELTLIVQDMRESGIRNVAELGKFAVRIDQCVYKHTGITTSTVFLENYNNDFIIIPTLTKGHVLNSKNFSKYLKDNFDADKISFLNLEQKGWIDSNTSRVGGAFSQVNFKMYLGDIDMLSKRYTPEEAASVIIHEVGHAFTFLQFLADTVIVNAVLQRSHAELTSSNADKKVKMILTKAADDMGIDNREWLQAIDDTSDADVAFRILASAVEIEPRLMDNKRFFTQDACEELAEIFAVRHGAGRALLTMRAQSKYGKYSRSSEYMQLAGWTIVSMASAFVMPEIGIPLTAVCIFATLATVYDHFKFASEVSDITKFKQTAAKIRNQFVEQVKASKLPKEELAALIDNINLADKLMQGYKGDFDPGTLSRFLDMFRRGKMDARASRAYTDKLETLVANDLFLRAAQFATR